MHASVGVKTLITVDLFVVFRDV